MVRFLIARTLVEVAKCLGRLAVKIVGYGQFEISIELVLKPLRNDTVDALLGILLLSFGLALFWIVTI